MENVLLVYIYNNTQLSIAIRAIQIQKKCTYIVVLSTRILKLLAFYNLT